MRIAQVSGLAAAVLLAALACGGPDRRPDVVVVVIDTLRADRLPFHGGPSGTAPFLASLAERSLVFENAFATSSWTAPSTASIFTGLHPNQHGVQVGLRAGAQREARDESYRLNRIPEDLETLPVYFASLGYRTYGVSTNPNIGEGLGFARGFHRFEPFDPATRKSADGLTEKVLGWKSEILAGDPFFLYLHLTDPHGPYRRHPEYLSTDSPPPKNPLDDIDAYDSEIRFADEHLRRIFGELGVLERDAIVVVTSDHGQEFLDHGRRGHGFQLYSELTWVPLLVHDTSRPDLRGRVEGVVSNVDVLPTLRALLEGRKAEGSLLAAARVGRGERQAFSMRLDPTGEAGSIASVVADRYKLIVREDGAAPELYDLERDPDEQHDIAASRPAIVDHLTRAIAVQRTQASRDGLRAAARYEPDPETAEQLRALGYAEGGHNLQP